MLRADKYERLLKRQGRWQQKQALVVSRPKQEFFDQDLSVNNITYWDERLGKKQVYMKKIHSGVSGPILNEETKTKQMFNGIKDKTVKMPPLFADKTAPNAESKHANEMAENKPPNPFLDLQGSRAQRIRKRWFGNKPTLEDKKANAFLDGFYKQAAHYTEQSELTHDNQAIRNAFNGYLAREVSPTVGGQFQDEQLQELKNNKALADNLAQHHQHVYRTNESSYNEGLGHGVGGAAGSILGGYLSNRMQSPQFKKQHPIASGGINLAGILGGGGLGYLAGGVLGNK